LIEVLLRLSILFDDAEKDALQEQIKPYRILGSQHYVCGLKSTYLPHELKKLGKFIMQYISMLK